MVDQRNFNFLAYGLMLAWGMLALYVAFLVLQERRLRGEMDKIRKYLEEKR